MWDHSCQLSNYVQIQRFFLERVYLDHFTPNLVNSGDRVQIALEEPSKKIILTEHFRLPTPLQNQKAQP